MNAPDPARVTRNAILARVRETLFTLDLTGKLLLARTEIRITEAVTTAAISRHGYRLRLKINPGFVHSQVTSVEDMRFLILHELFHVRMGHLHLPFDSDPATHIAMDALINAQLCHLDPQPDAWALLRRCYAHDVLPQALLRPPEGWPQAPRWPFTGRLGLLHRALYTEISVSLEEIVEILEEELPSAGIAPEDSVNEALQRDEPEILLLGNHAGAGEEIQDPELLAIAERILAGGEDVQEDREDVPEQDAPLPVSGIGPAGNEERYRIQPSLPPSGWRTCLEQAIRWLRNLSSGMDPQEDIEEGMAYLPGFSRHDRRARVLSHYGHSPLLQRHRLLQQAPCLLERIHLYLDVSSSMSEVLPRVYGALVPFLSHFHPQVHLFSVDLRHLPIELLHEGEVISDGGTCLEAVIDHRRRHAHAPALVVTDGLVPPPENLRPGELSSTRTLVLLTGDELPEFADSTGWPWLRFPDDWTIERSRES